jgi:CheY-like chemotaxis protein
MAQPQKILIVEDNLDNLSIYTTILEFTGFKVLSAKDGPTGLAAAREQSPDLILMDVSIPGIDGWEVTRLLKADSATQRIPIIVLTAHALETDRLRALAEGADGYIPKPAEPMSVVRAVRKLLGQNPDPSGTARPQAEAQPTA